MSEKSTINKPKAQSSRYFATYLHCVVKPVLHSSDYAFYRKTVSVIFFFSFQYVADNTRLLGNVTLANTTIHKNYEIMSMYKGTLIYSFPSRKVTTFQSQRTHTFAIKESVERVYSANTAVTSTTTRGIENFGDRTSMPSSSVVESRRRGQRQARIRDNRTGNFV